MIIIGGSGIEASNGSEKEKPYENLFAILIAISAATSGLAGFLSAEAGGAATDAANVSLKWQTEATASYDRSMQFILNDQQIMSNARVQETLGDINHDMTYYTIAEELRSDAMCVSMGYIDTDGTGSYAYNDDFDQAWAAYAQTMLADYNSFMKKSDEFTALSTEKGGEATAYLLVTVVLAFGAVVGAVGTSLSKKMTRQIMLVIMVAIIIVTTIYTLMI